LRKLRRTSERSVAHDAPRSTKCAPSKKSFE
jgi:hypothetical protein